MKTGLMRFLSGVWLLILGAGAWGGEDGGRMTWWMDARFGMFIHWGPVSLEGTEIGWSRGGERRGYGSRGSEVPVEVYDHLYREFNPEGFDARAWVEVARAAGMKYVVFTSRHHDGFSMFDTRASEYRITSEESPFGRDVVKELSEACHEAGMRFGVYYSQPDWHHADAFTEEGHDRYLEYLKRQVTELCTNYGRLDVFWFDGLGKRAEEYDGAGLVEIIRRLQPGIVINDRTGLPEDHDTPEQRVGQYQDDRPWESCITICRQWAWKPGDEMKSLEECLQTLVRCAGGDGNLLFNVGPMPDGRIEPRQVERLAEMGEWLGRYGESVYGTRGGPWKPTRTLASTRRGSVAYVHLLESGQGRVELPDIGVGVKSAVLLGGGTVGVEQRDGKLMLEVDPVLMDPIDTVVRIEFEASVMGVAAVSVVPIVEARASNVYQGHVTDFGPGQALDGDPATRWATDSGTLSAWIEWDMGKEVEVGRVRIQEAYAGRVKRFELQVDDGGAWRRVMEGEGLGERFEREIDPVRGRRFRLEILEASEGPTISEIQLRPRGDADRGGAF
ncbi:MAG: hypothetical protein RI897_1138 [Verrucomicrobiota bacterium]|jgi:alpha-L-fucosidase